MNPFKSYRALSHPTEASEVIQLKVSLNLLEVAIPYYRKILTKHPECLLVVDPCSTDDQWDMIFKEKTL